MSANEFLTLEGLVRSSTLIEISQPRSGKNLEVSIIEAAMDANLALLRIEDPSRLSKATHFPIAKEWPDADTVEIIQLDSSGEIQVGSAEVLKSEVERLSNGAGSGLTFKLRSNMALNDNGCAVIHNKELIGIVDSYDGDSRRVTVIPCNTLNKFVSEVRSSTYRGFATAGFSWTPLSDPVKRRYLKVPEEAGGILITSLHPGTDAMRQLKRQDVIVGWNGYTIDPLGYYEDPEFGRLIISYLIKGHSRPGDKVKVDIFRNGKRQTLELSLVSSSELTGMIPEDAGGDKPEYLVEGGIVLRELTGRYLRSFGNNWERRVNPRLAYTYQESFRTDHDPEQRVVIISRILPHKINSGYESFMQNMVTHVNGKPIRNMKELFAVRDEDKHITHIRLLGSDVDLVLDEKAIEAANQVVSKNYGIIEPAYRRPSE